MHVVAAKEVMPASLQHICEFFTMVMITVCFNRI
jgi:hypothetical protein